MSVGRKIAYFVAVIAMALIGAGRMVGGVMLLLRNRWGPGVAGAILVLYPLAATMNGPLLYGGFQPTEILVNVALAALVVCLLWYGRPASTAPAGPPRR